MKNDVCTQSGAYAALLIVVFLSFHAYAAGLSSEAVSHPLLVASGERDVTRASVTADATGAFHVVWVNAQGDVYVRSGTLGALSRPRLLNAPSERGADPVLAVSLSDDPPALAWSAERLPGEWDLRFAPSPSIDPRWLTEDPPSLGTQPDRRPALAERGDSTLVVWERGDPPAIAYAVVTPGTPFPPIKAFPSAQPAVRPIVTVGPQGPFWVAWTAETSSGGETWVAGVGSGGVYGPSPIREGVDDRFPSLAVDREGRPHVVWQEGREGGAVLYAYGLLGGGFSPALVLTPADARAAYPHIAFLDDGIPRVVWRDLASGALKGTMILDGRMLVPLTLVSEEKHPRLEGVWPGLIATPFNLMLLTFLAPAPYTGITGVWISFYGERESGAETRRPRAEGETNDGGANAPRERPSFRVTPNPFNATTALVVELPKPAEVRAEVFGITGVRLARLVEKTFPAGVHRIIWDGRDARGQAVASGVYFIRCVVRCEDGTLLLRTLSVTLLR